MELYKENTAGHSRKTKNKYGNRGGQICDYWHGGKTNGAKENMTTTGLVAVMMMIMTMMVSLLNNTVPKYSQMDFVCVRNFN